MFFHDIVLMPWKFLYMRNQKIGINNTTFKANYFTVNKSGKYFNLTSISTDNEENLGKEPVLEYNDRKGKKKEIPMVYDGKYYCTKYSCPTGNFKYRIFYKDTNKYEKDGVEQQINPLYFTKIAKLEDIKHNNLSMEHHIAKGEVEGKVFVNTYDIPKNVPAILVLDEIGNEEDIMLKIPDNVKGVVVSSGDMGTLDHIHNLTRNKYQVFGIVWDNDKFTDLKKQQNKYLSLNNENGNLEYKEINPAIEKKHIKETSKVEIPKLENIERLLTFDELTPQNCGNKGYRLSIIKKLIEEGELKDINVPKGFVIPNGYINKLKEYIDVEDKEESDDLLYDGIYTQEVDKKVEELGMNRGRLIIRSNYNTEDLGSFSSAGIYESRLNYDDCILPTTLRIIDESKTSNFAQYVHKKYGIEESQIQPSVIVQDFVNRNYDFTVYSDDGDNNIIIQLKDYSMGYQRQNTALIKYNKNTKELNIENKQSPLAKYLLDENGKIIEQSQEDDTITQNWKFLTPLLGIVTSGALVLEKLFKRPQDIEGGITKDGNVWFWQTRDIVAKGKKRI